MCGNILPRQEAIARCKAQAYEQELVHRVRFSSRVDKTNAQRAHSFRKPNTVCSGRVTGANTGRTHRVAVVLRARELCVGAPGALCRWLIGGGAYKTVQQEEHTKRTQRVRLQHTQPSHQARYLYNIQYYQRVEGCLHTRHTHRMGRPTYEAPTREHTHKHTQTHTNTNKHTAVSAARQSTVRAHAVAAPSILPSSTRGTVTVTQTHSTITHDPPDKACRA